jgi:hypothetical protein
MLKTLYVRNLQMFKISYSISCKSFQQSLMFESKAGVVYPTVEHLSSLLWTFINYGRKEFYLLLVG